VGTPVERTGAAQVMSSSMPRALATVEQIREGRLEPFATLNPLDKGIYRGLTVFELAASQDATAKAFIQQWSKDALQVRRATRPI
jgi:broad specificity phosphatase PhoE